MTDQSTSTLITASLFVGIPILILAIVAGAFFVAVRTELRTLSDAVLVLAGKHDPLSKDVGTIKDTTTATASSVQVIRDRTARWPSPNE